MKFSKILMKFSVLHFLILILLLFYQKKKKMPRGDLELLKQECKEGEKSVNIQLLLSEMQQLVLEKKRAEGFLQTLLLLPLESQDW